MDLIGSSLILLGSVIVLIAGLGVWRMPDVYNRLQAGTKASTLGLIFIFAGLGFLMPVYWPKVVLLILFVLLTNPLSSHVLARTAHRIGVPLCGQTDGDALKEADEVSDPSSLPEPRDPEEGSAP